MSAASRITTVRIVVPARDEERLIGRCLDSLARATAALRARHPDVRCTTTVVLDACRDGTETVVGAYGAVTPVVSRAGAVGPARALGIERACRGDDPQATWVATTDADSVVPEHWLTTQLDLAASGYDLIVGTVMPEAEDVDPGTLASWWARHCLIEGHDHIHGANLGFLLGAYREAGGFEPLALHEDVRLVHAIRGHHRRHIATARTQVMTSGRRVSRAAGGFASYLEALRTGAPNAAVIPATNT